MCFCQRPQPVECSLYGPIACLTLVSTAWDKKIMSKGSWFYFPKLNFPKVLELSCFAAQKKSNRKAMSNLVSWEIWTILVSCRQGWRNPRMAISCGLRLIACYLYGAVAQFQNKRSNKLVNSYELWSLHYTLCSQHSTVCSPLHLANCELFAVQWACFESYVGRFGFEKTWNQIYSSIREYHFWHYFALQRTWKPMRKIVKA